MLTQHKYRQPKEGQWMVLLWLGLAFMTNAISAKPHPQTWPRSEREALAGQHSERHRQQRQNAWRVATRQGWETHGVKNNRSFDLQAIENGLVYLRATRNEEAAILTGTDLIRSPEVYGLRGYGQAVGIWDVGNVRPTHLEFGQRVFCWDSSFSADHATHICGTLAATGLDPDAMGMAPDVFVHSYDSENDLAEATLRAMSAPAEPNMIQLSNHSYGWVCGWDYDTLPPRWYGHWGLEECELFGQYDQEAAVWDDLCYRAPYYLPVRAVGNDREHAAPEPGIYFYYYTEDQGWQTKAYDPSTDPGDDGGALGGYDTVCADATAKNILSIGAIGLKRAKNKNGNLRDNVIGTSFSGWGPTDDGRIKPDLVTNGTRIFSTTAQGDDTYDLMGGTSMACGVACGSAVLLCEQYSNLFPGQAMRSATLKGLLIHTAEDLGPAGPDFQYGWGLLRVDRAATHLEFHSQHPEALALVEDGLGSSQTPKTYTLSVENNVSLRVTLCWTDPPDTARTSLNDKTPCLVHDLDLRVIDAGSTLHEPYVLNFQAPDLPAWRGDNSRDNVEQITLPVTAAESYRVQVSCKTRLDSPQLYTLLVTQTSSAID